MINTGQNGQDKNRNTAAAKGWRRYRGLVYAASAAALVGAIIAGAILFDTTGEAETEPDYAAPTVGGVSATPGVTDGAFPRTVTPTSDAGPAPVTVQPSDQPDFDPTAPVTSTPGSTGTGTATATTTSTVAPVVGGGTSTTPTVGEPASATPALSTPAPANGLWPAATSLVAQIESQWGIDVVTQGQNWGANEDQQVRNLTALYDAMQALPAGIVSIATHNNHGTLVVLSNNDGRTLSGWQPYGGGAANFYATEDVTAAGRVETSQVILQTGSTAMTIAHELLHAYQMRDVTPGLYGQALLTSEMTSFMQATGWTPNVSPEVLAASVNGNWDVIGSLFDYTGPELVYTSETGETVHAHTPNPIEAFAVIGALYYAAPEGTPLPGWAAYWAWFDANLG